MQKVKESAAEPEQWMELPSVVYHFLSIFRCCKPALAKDTKGGVRSAWVGATTTTKICDHWCEFASDTEHTSSLSLQLRHHGAGTI